MKKLFFVFVGSCVFIGIFLTQAYATTAFFTTKDGRVFCESDAFDGSYKLCTKEQSTGTGLVKAEKYNARLVDTTLGRICVEDGTEVTTCPEEKKNVPQTIATGGIQSPITTTNTTATITPSSVVTSQVSETGSNVPKVTVTKPTIVDDGGLLSSFTTMVESCFEKKGAISCGKAITKMTDTFTSLGTFSIISIVVIFFGSTIFWFNMISHAFAHPIPIKPVWIAILLVLSIPGAVLYYFAALRPYEAMIIASSPPKPPSFFD